MHHLARAVIIVALPAVVFVGGAQIMTWLSGRARVVERLATLPDADRKPLNQRLHYDRAAVARHWSAFDAPAVQSETAFYEMDLTFPLFYGGAFLVAMLLGWATAGRPFHPGWLIALVALTIASDWTENLVLLPQLRDFGAHGAPALDAGRIAIASAATLVKLAGAVGLSLATLALAVTALRAQP